MKKIKVLFFALLLLIFTPKIYAACDDVDLNDLAEKFNAGYVEDSEQKIQLEDGSYKLYKKEYAYLILFTPYSSDLKVVVNDSISKKNQEATYDERRGTYLIGSNIHYKEKVYTVNVYGNEKSACPNQLLKTMSFTIPSFNEYSLYSYCTDNKDADICTMMKDTSDVTMTEYKEIVAQDAENKKVEKMSFIQKVLYYISKYWIFVAVPILLISTYYIITIIVYKKKVSKR